MLFSAHQIPYKQTGKFSRIVLDYLENAPELQNYFSLKPDLEGVKSAIQQKQKQTINRSLLTDVLKEQYETAVTSEKVKANIELLRSENSFSICTAHQPNLFTGPLYLIYKILHVIKLADQLKQQLPGYNFIPVYYMGSEDADLAELNHFVVDGKRYEWKTKQTGAVGRMKVDDLLLQVINELSGQLTAYPNGEQFLQIIRNCFQKGVSVQQATFLLVNELFSDFGLVVLIADHSALKSSMQQVFRDDLFEQIPSSIVSETSKQLSEQYNAQAYPRDINLFYLKDNIRERIIKNETGFSVQNTGITFSDHEIETELKDFPERFSPNVILRGLYQETILPNIAFIGGGGELAYWLQLKSLFDHYQTPFPLLILRNSFLLIESKWMQKVRKMNFTLEDIFQPEADLVNSLVKRDTNHKLSLNGSFTKAEQVYEEIRQQALSVDSTLGPHVAAIKTQSLKLLTELEKKMLRAEKKKFEAEERQIKALKHQLFPKEGLQERFDNIGYWYSVYGREVLRELYQYSLGLEQQFTILITKDDQ